MNLICANAFSSLINTDTAHNRQSVDMTEVWDSEELLNTCSGSSYFISENERHALSPA